MEDIAKHAGLDYKILNFKYNEIPDAEIIAKELESDPAITHVSMVHCETTSGILNNAVSLSLDLYDQWKGMDKDGKWRFTSPTHVVLAFAKALDELEAEGGIKSRFARYSENNRLLIEKMTALGFRTYLDCNQSPIITTFLYPDTEDFTFEKMYNFIKERGYAIYPQGRRHSC